MSELEQFLLLDSKGYYWIWLNGHVNGPHSEKYINLDPIQVDNPFDFKPPSESEDDINLYSTPPEDK